MKVERVTKWTSSTSRFTTVHEFDHSICIIKVLRAQQKYVKARIALGYIVQLVIEAKQAMHRKFTFNLTWTNILMFLQVLELSSTICLHENLNDVKFNDKSFKALSINYKCPCSMTSLL